MFRRRKQGTIYEYQPNRSSLRAPFRSWFSFLKKFVVATALFALIYQLNFNANQFKTLADSESSLPTFGINKTITRQDLLEIPQAKQVITTLNFVPSYLIINKINLATEIETVGGTMGDWQVPDFIPGTPSVKSRVGGETNLSVWGHRATIFNRLGEMQEGDIISVSNGTTLRRYRIYEMKVINPNPEDGVEILPTEEQILTLITCHPDDTFNQRLIIHAKLVEASQTI